jgi:hypothetical protein
VLLKEAFHWDLLVAVRDFQEGKVVANVTVRPAVLDTAPVRQALDRYGINLPTTWKAIYEAFGGGGNREVHVEELSPENAPTRRFRAIVKVRPGEWAEAVNTRWVQVGLKPKVRMVASAKGEGSVLRIVPFAGATLEADAYDALLSDPAVAGLVSQWKSRVEVEACGRIRGAERYGSHETAFEAPIVARAGWIKQFEIVPDSPYTRQILLGILYVLGLGALFALAVVALKKMARV